MPHLLLAGPVIVAAAAEVTPTPDGWRTPEAIYPRAAGVTDVIYLARLPEDFSPTRYEWRDGLVRLPDPPPPPPPPEPVPQRVTALQARRALLAADMLDQVEAAIARQSRAIQIAWEYATEIYRDDPALAEAAQALGLDANTLDDLFRAASKL
jgi:hypothetical protein